MADVRGRICFVLGTPFCGSTAFGNFLNTLSPNTYLGEVEILPQFVSGYNGPMRDVHCWTCESKQRECELWGPDRVADLARLDAVEFYRTLLRSTSTGVVIDGSKSPRLLHEIYHALSAEFDVRAIVLVRNPLLSMASYLRAVELNHLGDPTRNAPAPQAWAAANFWRDVYSHALSIIGHFEIPSIVFHTVHLRQSTTSDLDVATKPVRRFIDERLGETMLDTAHPLSSYFEPSHQISGNPGTNMGRTNTELFAITGKIGGAQAYIDDHGPDDLIDAFFSCPAAAHTASLLGVNMRACIDEVEKLASKP